MDRKNHNSIIFLTTIGVYLGLVLVGATPQALAQAATAKQFAIREEAGTRDDLDKNPDDSSPVRSVPFELEYIERFLVALDDLNRRGRFDLLPDRFDLTQSVLPPYTAQEASPVFSTRTTPIRTATLRHELVRQVAQHTVVVTRLPRGSLDSLLASNAQ